LLGAGIGALAGQAIGGDTEATLIGTAVGAGAGYIIGNESDKTKAQQQGQAWSGADYDY
jgi:outer membrane lipoprotein SlyB